MNLPCPSSPYLPNPYHWQNSHSFVFPPWFTCYHFVATALTVSSAAAVSSHLQSLAKRTPSLFQSCCCLWSNSPKNDLLLDDSSTIPSRIVQVCSWTTTFLRWALMWIQRTHVCSVDDVMVWASKWRGRRGMLGREPQWWFDGRKRDYGNADILLWKQVLAITILAMKPNRHPLVFWSLVCISV